MKIKPFDIIFLIIILLVTAILSYTIYAGTEGEPKAHIKATSGEWFYSLKRKRELSIEGPLGRTIIIIENGSVSVRSSPCPEKICVKSGHKQNAGEWIACLPNGILITIEGNGQPKIDATSY